MARYIDADKFEKDLAEACVHKAVVMSVLNRQPTADVVPKSEVERLEAQIAQYQLDLHYSVCREEDAMRRTAREIFEEIEAMCVDVFGNFHPVVFAELKKKYTKSEGKE